jgi:hypothetical protein
VFPLVDAGTLPIPGRVFRYLGRAFVGAGSGSSSPPMRSAASRVSESVGSSGLLGDGGPADESRTDLDEHQADDAADGPERAA